MLESEEGYIAKTTEHFSNFLSEDPVDMHLRYKRQWGIAIFGMATAALDWSGANQYQIVELHKAMASESEANKVMFSEVQLNSQHLNAIKLA